MLRFGRKTMNNIGKVVGFAAMAIITLVLAALVDLFADNLVGLASFSVLVLVAQWLTKASLGLAAIKVIAFGAQTLMGRLQPLAVFSRLKGAVEECALLVVTFLLSIFALSIPEYLSNLTIPIERIWWLKPGSQFVGLLIILMGAGVFFSAAYSTIKEDVLPCFRNTTGGV
jgi:hypothetical protein